MRPIACVALAGLRLTSVGPAQASATDWGSALLSGDLIFNSWLENPVTSALEEPTERVDLQSWSKLAPGYSESSVVQSSSNPAPREPRPAFSPGPQAPKSSRLLSTQTVPSLRRYASAIVMPMSSQTWADDATTMTRSQHSKICGLRPEPEPSVTKIQLVTLESHALES